jgi:hypothetical protein
MYGVRFPVGARDFSRIHSVQTDSGVHPASYPACTISPAVEHPEREADYSLRSNVEVKNLRSYTSTPPYVSKVKGKAILVTGHQDP